MRFRHLFKDTVVQGKHDAGGIIGESDRFEFVEKKRIEIHHFILNRINFTIDVKKNQLS